MFNVVLTSLLLLLAFGQGVHAAVRYVDASGGNPTPPYTNWATAARVIQEAVDVAAWGDEVAVTNGTYATGGRPVGTNTLVNRVAVDKPLLVRSVNGPQFTVIQGYQVPVTTNGDGAIRCVYLADGASLSGFTLTNGATRTNRDSSFDQGGGGVWCESTSAVVSRCILSGNSAANEGGGAAQGTLNNCTLTGNSADVGGGAYGATLNNCTLTGNYALYLGGGAAQGTLNNCTVTGNSAAQAGGGVSIGVGGIEANNCIVYFNTAAKGANYYAGADNDGAILNYCCTTPLAAAGVGNISLDPQLASASHLSATSPCRGAGSTAYATGTDIDGEAWANPPSIGCDEYHHGAVTGPLNVAIVAAFTNVATGFPVDLRTLIEGRTTASMWDFGDGVVVSNRPCASHAWMAPGNYAVVLRAYSEIAPAGESATVMVHVVTQPVHYVATGSANPLAPYASWATAATSIQDAVDAAVVPGALVLATDGTYATGGRAVHGLMTNRVVVDKPLTVRSVNGPQVTVIQGYQVPGTTNGDGAVRCVYLTNGASLSGFTLTNGATRSAGDPDHEQSGGGLWCESLNAVVSNCVLAGNSAISGGGVAYGTLNNCTLSGNSAPGSNSGDRDGGGALYTTLNSSTLSGNWAGWMGGGAHFSTLNNCWLTGNSASQSGGGASYCTLNNCTVTGNSAFFGGGADSSTLNNCTLSGNSAGSGGGAGQCTLNNCIVYFNTAPDSPNYVQFYGPPMNYCCTTPLPTNGVGNISNAPLFVGYAGGNLRLQSNSPCINGGKNAYASGSTDLDGNPRIVSGTVDIGAYEYQGRGSVISYAWLQLYGLPTDGSADFLDSDGDGLYNWQEWRCQTDPTNALSALRLSPPARAGTNVIVTWRSVAGVNYLLERSTNLSASPPFSLLSTNFPGQADITSFTDTNAPVLGPVFYRIGIGN